MDTINLRLFGVIHLDRLGKVTTELEEYAKEVDALFIEYPEEDPSWQMYGRCLLKTPAVFFAFVFSGLVQMPLFVVLNREISPVFSTEMTAARRLSDEHDIPLYRVDDHPLFIAAESPWTWVVLNWGIVAGLAVLWPQSLLTTIVSLLAPWLVVGIVIRRTRTLGTLFGAIVPWSALAIEFWYGLLSLSIILVFLLAFAVLMKRTLSHRNRHMLRKVESLSTEYGYEHACLITGKAHLGGLIRLAEDTGISLSRSRTSKWLRHSDDEQCGPHSGTDAKEQGIFTHPRPEDSLDTGIMSQRIGAGVIDLICVGVLMIPMAVVGGVLFGLTFGDGTIGVGLLVGALSTPLLYGFTLEALFGRTVGKRFLGLVVVTDDGSQCSTRTAAVRNVLRIVDFPVFYVVGFVVITLTARHQRLGDLVAGTAVVKVRS
ncbi:MAG TPA: RDD family protein [Halococcus sp.]|nr:RDD family protein [Halococcus sp.]